VVEIVLDTNFITIPFDFRVDIYAEIERIVDEPYELVFPKICINEISRLKTGKGALDLMQKKGVKVVEIPLKKTVDDSIVSYANEHKAIIATQDAELRKKALKNSLSVITLREKQFLIKIGGM